MSSQECEELQLLPEELVGRAFSFLQPENVLTVRCVNTRIAGIGMAYLKRSALQADPLSAEIFSSLVDDEHCSLRPATLWKNLLIARDGRRKSVMRDKHDYHNVVDAGGVPPFYLDANDGRDLPQWMEPYSNFRFAVQLWTLGSDGELSSIRVEIPKDDVVLDELDSKLILERGMGDSAEVMQAKIARQLQSGDYYALEILIGSLSTDRGTMNKNGGPTCWATLYSSLNPLVPYGGGSYEEYQSMPWFVGVPGDNEGDAENWASLPFCEASFEITGHGVTLISLRFHWRTRQGQSLDYDDYWETLEELNCLVLWTHRCSQAYGARFDDGRLSKPKCQIREPLAGLANFAPKPLKAYSFRIDIQKKSDRSDTHSIFFEQLPGQELLADGEFPKLQFVIPTNHHNHFPWAEDYNTNNTTQLMIDEDHIDQIVQFDEDISIYAIDRRSGKQAKLFQSSLAQIWEEHTYFDSHPFFGFEKSAALTQYSFGDVSPNIPVPTIRALMHGAWKKQELEEEDSRRCFDLSLNFLCFSGRQTQRGGAFAIGGQEGSSSHDLLVFLEKGLTYH